MTRASVATLVVAVLFVSSSDGGAADGSPAYGVVRSAHIFAIGGIGRAGIITEEEKAYDTLLKTPDAAQQFHRLLAEATIEGQMYALLGLRTLHAPEYTAELNRYRRSRGKVKTGSGCIIGHYEVSDIVTEWIDKMSLK